MSEIVPFTCPQHGWVLDALASSRVECKCGEEAAPEGRTPDEHRSLIAKAKSNAQAYQKRLKRSRESAGHSVAVSGSGVSSG